MVILTGLSLETSRISSESPKPKSENRSSSPMISRRTFSDITTTSLPIMVRLMISTVDDYIYSMFKIHITVKT